MHGRIPLALRIGFLTLLFVASNCATAARADPPPDAGSDEDPASHRLDLLDAREAREAREAQLRERDAPTSPASRPPLWVTLSGKLSSRDDARRAYGGMVMLGVPLERFATPRRRATMAPERAKSSVLDDNEPHRPALSFELDEDPPRPPPEVHLTPKDARAAVRAALVERGLVAANARVGGLESRAKASALLPELRLRVTRLVDEDERLSPTEYDPTRTMESGGTSLWMEARATWKLDRLVFADEEVALARLRLAQRRERQRVVADVLALLLVWQRAISHASDEWADPDHRWQAALDAETAAISLDVETGGWFSRWQQKRDKTLRHERRR